MSPRRPNLSSPPVVAGVLVVLAVLIAVNVRTFGPRRSGVRARTASEVRVQAHPSLPQDLEDVLRQAGHPAGDLGAPVTGPRPEMSRDPFVAGAAARVSAPAAVGVRTPVRVTRTGRPVCTAVMLGAGAPAALIDGRLCRVGDLVQQYTVERIDARGVSLSGERSLFLPVGVASAGEGANVFVTGVATGDRAGRTSLVEYADSERK